MSGAGQEGNGEGGMNRGYRILIYKMKRSGDWLPDNVNILNTAALFS